MEKERGEREKFSTEDLTGLTALLNKLLEQDLDYHNAAETIKMFLTTQGYGSSHDDVNQIAVDFKTLKPEDFKNRLENIAREM